MWKRLGELIGPVVVDAEKELRASQAGRELNRLFKRRDGGGELVLKMPDQAQTLERFGVRAQFEAGFVFAFGPGEIPCCLGFLGSLKMALHTGGLARQERAEQQDTCWNQLWRTLQRAAPRLVSAPGVAGSRESKRRHECRRGTLKRAPRQ